MRFFNTAGPCRPSNPEQTMLIAAECIHAQVQRLLPAGERPARLDEIIGMNLPKAA